MNLKESDTPKFGDSRVPLLILKFRALLMVTGRQHAQFFGDFADRRTRNLAIHLFLHYDVMLQRRSSTSSDEPNMTISFSLV